MTAQHFVRYEVDDRVAVITLDRPEAANAQTPGILKDLDDAWRRADEDPDVRVIVFQTTGKHFSAGHDMSGNDPSADGRNLRPQRTDGKLLADTYYDWETRGYLEYAKRWRDIPKPSIAAVQGKCIAAGLMLCWPCDLIVAADNAQFSDPVGLMGIMGIEYHAHTWELGPRKAKEMLFTAGSVTAEEALRTGMVNHVVPLAGLAVGHHDSRSPRRPDRPLGAAPGQAGRQPHPGHHGLLDRDRLLFRHASSRTHQGAGRDRRADRRDGQPGTDERRGPREVSYRRSIRLASKLFHACGRSSMTTRSCRANTAASRPAILPNCG